MRLPVRVAIVTLLGIAAAPSMANEGAAAAWQAGQQAEARAATALQSLSDRYAAIWSSLDRAEKAQFSARERAWLNDGRQQEQRACAVGIGAPADLVVKTCEADVLERHLAALPAPQRIGANPGTAVSRPPSI